MLLAICYNNGRKAKYSEDTETLNEVEEEEAVPFKDAIKMLFGNKYWVIVLLFNIITNVTNAIAAASGTYYCKWIFGNDNLVAITGIAGLAATLLGFVLAKPIISKLGIRKRFTWGVRSGNYLCGQVCRSDEFHGMYGDVLNRKFSTDSADVLIWSASCNGCRL